MWRTFQLGSTVSKIPEDCFKSRDTFMKLAGRKKTAFITELFKKCLMLWWKQFHTADLKIDPIIKHYTQFPWYYIKRSKKIQHESDTFPLYLWNNESLCGSAYQSQKGNLLYLSYSLLWKIIHDPWTVNFCNLKRSVCISGTTVFKIQIQVILQRIRNFIIGWLDLIKKGIRYGSSSLKNN